MGRRVLPSRLLGGYPCCASASANVYGHWGTTTYSGTRSWYAGGGVAGTTASGNYYNNRTGTSGSYNAGKQYNAWTGNYTRGYDRTANGAAGGSGEAARGVNTNEYTGQRTTANAVSGPAPAAAPTTARARRRPDPKAMRMSAAVPPTTPTTGKTNTWGTASVNGNHYADVNGNVYKNTGDGWQQHSSSGWGSASGDTSWADRESQARSTGDDRWGGFSGADHSFGGGGGGGGFGGGDRSVGGFGGGGFGGDRFGGGGFGGGGFRGGGRR